MKKIGQEIIVEEDFEISNIVSNKIMTVKKGDKGFLDSKGFIHLTTGNGRGKIVKINDVNIEVEGYDYENISNIILNRLNREFGIEELLENEIEDVLTDIL